MNSRTQLRRLMTASILLLAGYTMVRAEDLRPVQPGDYIRGRWINPDKPSESKAFEGRLLALDEFTYTIQQAGVDRQVSLIRQDVRHLDLRTRPSSNDKGALIGMAI